MGVCFSFPVFFFLLCLEIQIIWEGNQLHKLAFHCTKAYRTLDLRQLLDELRNIPNVVLQNINIVFKICRSRKNGDGWVSAKC